MADPNPKIVIRAKDETKRAFKAARFRMKGLKDAAFSLQGAFVGLAGVGVGSMISQTLKAQDEIGKLSTRLGASTEALSEYRFVAEQTGVSFQTLTMGFQRMTRRVSEAANGTGEARGALAELNIDAVRLNQLAPDKQFELLADALMKVKNPADQVRLAMKLFDSEGVALIQTAQGGSKAIADLRKQARQLGFSLSEEQTAAAEKANNAMSRLKTAFRGLSNELTTELAPSLESIADTLTDTIPAAVKITEGVIDHLGDSIFRFWETFAEPPGGIGGGLDKARAKLAELERLAASTGGGNKLIFEQQAAAQRAVVEQLESVETQLEKHRAAWRETYELINDRPTAPDDQDGGAGGTEIDDWLSVKADENNIKFSMEAKHQQRIRQMITDEQTEFNISQADVMEEQFSAEARHQQRITQNLKDEQASRTAFSQMSAAQQRKAVVGEMVNMTRGVAQHNKTMFKINKAAGIANAIINAWQGASRTMAEYPYPLNAVLAGLSLASGMAQVQAIKSQSFSGGGGGGTIVGAAGGGSATLLPQAPSDVGSGTTGPTEISINVSGTGVLDRDQAESIAQSIAEYINDGGEAFAT